MKQLIIFLLVAITMTALPAILIFSTITPQPQIEQGAGLSFDRVKRVKQLVRRHKPRFMKSRQLQTIRIQETDLNLLLDYGVSQGMKTDRIFPDLSLSDEGGIIGISIKIPKTFLGEYVNLEMGMIHDQNRLEIAYIRAGKLKIPGMIITPLIPIVAKLVLPTEVYTGMKDNLDGIQSVSTREKTLTLVYDWNPSSLLKLHENGKSLLIPQAHQKKLVVYTNQLTRILDILKANQVNTISLARVIRPLFRFAADQSQIFDDPVMENTALLQSLSLYALGVGIDHLVNSNLLKEVQPRRRCRLTLHGRADLAKHFLVSAGISASAGSRLSHFAGLAKEVEDAGRGSGFSFADLAADKAGVKLGELATGSGKQAHQIQNQMAKVKTEAEFMPGIDRLAEGIMELEFKKRYTDLDSKAYGMIDKEINQRLNECRVYQ